MQTANYFDNVLTTGGLQGGKRRIKQREKIHWRKKIILMIAESANFERTLEFQYLNEPDYVVRYKTGYNIIYIISFITFSHYNIGNMAKQY